MKLRNMTSIYPLYAGSTTPDGMVFTVLEDFEG